jgi:N-acyl-D-amino-acid deacylase
MLDILIRGGTVIDGSGALGRRADVAIEGDRIRAVEPLPSADAARVIDATGLAVAPGFIDMHSHADFVLPGLPTADSKVHQGFTLEVVGNCGASPAPLTPARRQDVIDTSALTVPALKWDPHRYPTGIPWVLVNSRPVNADGRHTGARPGQLVTR